MFMDGLLYACISRNMAFGVGSFWHPELTQTLYASFYEHPPLAFWLQSHWFSVFGDYELVERFYSLSCFVFTGLIMRRIWRDMAIPSLRHHAWIPILLWFSFSLVFWAVSNNMLENTMMIFTTLAVWLFFRKSGPRWMNLMFMGWSLLAGFMVKGFVALFPLSLPFWAWIFRKEYNLVRCLKELGWIILFGGVAFLILVGLMPESLAFFERYIEKQLLGSLKNVQTVSSRWYILWRLFTESLPILGVLLVFAWMNRKRKALETKSPEAWILLGLALSGVFPIMISMKQSGFYILASFPILALSLGLIISPSIEIFRKLYGGNKSIYKRIMFLAIILFGLGVGLSVYFAGRIGRDEKLLEDINLMIEVIPTNSIVSIEPDLYENWSLHGYFQRKASISLDPNGQHGHDFYLLKKETDFPIPTIYRQVMLPLSGYQLYTKE